MGDRCMPWRGTAALGVVFLAFVLYSIPDGMLRSIQFMMYGSSNFGKNGFAAMQNTEAIAEFNLAGKTIMVTGGNGGLGFETCRMLADTQATVLMVARSEERGRAAVEKIGAPNVKLMLCDVSRQDAVAQLIEQVDSLDVPILNAGTLFSDDRYEENADGVERTLATNVLNNVQLVDGLLPVLKKSADPRVIFVSSGGGLTEPLATNKAEYDAGKFTGMTAYARTKRMQMALAKYYARHEPDIFFCSMHPGWSETDGVKTSISGFSRRSSPGSARRPRAPTPWHDLPAPRQLTKRPRMAPYSAIVPSSWSIFAGPARHTAMTIRRPCTVFSKDS